MDCKSKTRMLSDSTHIYDNQFIMTFQLLDYNLIVLKWIGNDISALVSRNGVLKRYR